MSRFRSEIYYDPAERAEARERFDRWDDERGDSDRERRRDAESDKPPRSVPNPIYRPVSVNGEEVWSWVEWGISTGGTVYLESITDAVGTDLIEHADKGELTRLVDELTKLL